MRRWFAWVSRSKAVGKLLSALVLLSLALASFGSNQYKWCKRRHRMIPLQMER